MRTCLILTFFLCVTGLPGVLASAEKTENAKDFVLETIENGKSVGKMFVLPSTNLERDLKVLFEDLFIQDMPNADEQTRADILMLIGRLAKGLKVPELPLSVRRAVSNDNGAVWSIGSEYGTVWNFVQIRGGEVVKISLTRMDGSCDGEPFGTCCGGNIVSDPPLWTTEKERLTIRDAIFRLHKDMRVFEPMEGFRPEDLPTVAQMPHLTQMSISNYAFTPKSVEYFQQFPMLRKISATDSTIDDLATLSLLNIEEFNGSVIQAPSSATESVPPPVPGRVCPIGNLNLWIDDDTPVFSRLHCFPELEKLTLRQARTSASDLKYFQDLPKLQELFMSVQVTDKPGSTLEFADLPQLRRLTVNFRSEETIQRIREKKLRYEDVAATEGYRVAVRRMPELRFLDTSPHSYGRSTTHLEELPQLTQLHMATSQKLTSENGTVLPNLIKIDGVRLDHDAMELIRASDKLKTMYRTPLLVEDFRDLEWFQDRFGKIDDFRAAFTPSVLAQFPEAPQTFQEDTPSGSGPARILDMSWFLWHGNSANFTLEAPELPDNGNIYVRLLSRVPEKTNQRKTLGHLRLTLKNIRLAPDNFILLHHASSVELHGKSVTAAVLKELNYCFESVDLKLVDVTPENADFFRELLSHRELADQEYPSRKYNRYPTSDTVEISFSEEAVERFRGQTLTFGPMPEVTALQLSAPSPGLKVAFPEGIGRIPKTKFVHQNVEVELPSGS